VNANLTLDQFATSQPPAAESEYNTEVEAWLAEQHHVHTTHACTHIYSHAVLTFHLNQITAAESEYNTEVEAWQAEQQQRAADAALAETMAAATESRSQRTAANLHFSRRAHNGSAVASSTSTSTKQSKQSSAAASRRGTPGGGRAVSTVGSATQKPLATFQ
jgi:hypothetical protein